MTRAARTGKVCKTTVGQRLAHDPRCHEVRTLAKWLSPLIEIKPPAIRGAAFDRSAFWCPGRDKTGHCHHWMISVRLPSSNSKSSRSSVPDR